MTDLINLNNEQKFTSLYLVEQINIYRKEEGSNDLFHSDFLKKIEREFNEEIGEGKISPTSYTDKSNRQSKCYELTFEQSLQILMSESKTVRKRVVEVLKKQQETIKNLTPVFKIPQTFKEALLLAVEQQEIIEKQEEEKKLLQAKSNKLEVKLDVLLTWVSIIKVSNHNAVKETYFNWRKLKSESKKLGYEIKKAESPRFGYMNLYHVNVFKSAYPELDYNIKDTI